MVHGHGLLTWYSETTVSSNADHPLFVWQLLSVLKSERRSFVLNSRKQMNATAATIYSKIQIRTQTESGLPVVLLFIVVSL